MIDAFSIKKIFILGWPILSVLLLCSVASIAVIMERFKFFRRVKVDVQDFLGKLESVLSEGKNAVKECRVLGEPMAAITRAALDSASHSRGNLDMAVDREVRMRVADMERFVPLLGTIAAAAPFIGLLGTVIGIIRAFRAISVSGSGGPQVVAAGIAEALVATALGLFVAIPALVAYNYFSTKIRRTTENIEICADELVETLSKK